MTTNVFFAFPHHNLPFENQQPGHAIVSNAGSLEDISNKPRFNALNSTCTHDSSKPAEIAHVIRQW